MILSPEGKRGILMFSERMVNYFIFGISGPRSGRWTEVNGNFGDDIRLMSTRSVDDLGLPRGTLLSVTTSFVLSLAPKTVFNYLRDHKYRKEVCPQLFLITTSLYSLLIGRTFGSNMHCKLV